jgi:hypothetical protein
MDDAKIYQDYLNRLLYSSRCVKVLSLLALFAGASAVHAQTPSPAATGSTEKSQEGFTPGWGFGMKFEGSSNGDRTITDLATGVSYNFSHHFGVDLGIPYYFVGTPSSIKQKNPSAVSGNGLGSFGADLKWNFPGKTLNYASTIHLGAPTGDTKKGLSTGHATWNSSNHIEHGWGNFTPFIDGGVGNTISDTRFFHRPFATFGYNAQFEGGTEFDAGPFSLTVSAYDVAPWGPQTAISRLFRCTSGAKCSAAGKTMNRKNYLESSVSSGDASLTRDNGFNAGVEVKPVRYLDLEFDYSRSVPLQLNNISFGISVDVGSLFRSRPQH